MELHCEHQTFRENTWFMNSKRFLGNPSLQRKLRKVYASYGIVVMDAFELWAAI